MGMKRIVSFFGVLGLLGCFLPLVPGLSWFELRHLDGWTVYLVFAAFALPAYVGAIKGQNDGAAALVGSASFGYLAYKFGTGVFDLVFHASIGGMMMGVAVIGGLATSLLALAARSR